MGMLLSFVPSSTHIQVFFWLSESLARAMPCRWCHHAWLEMKGGRGSPGVRRGSEALLLDLLERAFMTPQTLTAKQ